MMNLWEGVEFLKQPMGGRKRRSGNRWCSQQQEEA